jgi:uncharacterized protein YkwD
MNGNIYAMKKMQIITLALAMIVITIGGLYTVSAFTKDGPLVDFSENTETKESLSSNEVLKLVNAEREKADVEALVLDESLNGSATAKVNEMHSLNYFDHVNPQTGKDSGLDAAKAANASCVYVGENLVDATSESDAIHQWINSPAHYKAMIDSKYDLTGFGISKDPTHSGYFYIVQHFCDLK